MNLGKLLFNFANLLVKLVALALLFFEQTLIFIFDFVDIQIVSALLFFKQYSVLFFEFWDLKLETINHFVTSFMINNNRSYFILLL